MAHGSDVSVKHLKKEILTSFLNFEIQRLTWLRNHLMPNDDIDMVINIAANCLLHIRAELRVI